MRRLFLSLIIFLSVGLSACGGSDTAFDSAYTASGDDENANSLFRTSQFRRTDGINVVVELKQRDEEAEVEVRFFYGTQNTPWERPLKAVAASDVGTVVLKLDFDTKGDATSWPEGGWQADVYVDGEKVETLDFTIQ